MANVFNSVWLYADDFNAGGSWATYTLVVPNLNVFAQIGVTTYAPVVHGDDLGGAAIGTRIVGYSYFQSPNVVIPVATPEDWNQNSIFIGNCASITFGLQCKNAWGYALGVVIEE